VFCFVTGLTFSGEGLSFLGFVQRHPTILPKMVLFGLASAVGQVRLDNYTISHNKHTLPN